MKKPTVILVSTISRMDRLCLNKLIPKCNSLGLEIKHLWQNIQHIDYFFLAETGVGLNASYNEKDDIIDFHDEDGTLIFYVKQL